MAVQGRAHAPRMPSWTEEGGNRLLVCTPRVTDSPLFSPCAPEALPGGRSRAPSEPPPAPSCDARSATSDDAAALPVLHDLEQHFCSAFLDDDFVPRKDARGAAPEPARRSLPVGLLAAGGGMADGPFLGDRAGKGAGPRAGGPQPETTLETGLSFFGPATAHSHFPEELGQLVEVHHYVAVTGAEREECGSLAALRRKLHAALTGTLPAR